MMITELLKNKTNVTRKELLEAGISDYEVRKLIAMEILTKIERASYQVNTKKVTELLLQDLLENQEQVTRKQLLNLNLSDYEIRKMLKEGRIFTLSRGTFATKVQIINDDEVERQKEKTDEEQSSIKTKMEEQVKIQSVDELWKLYLKNLNRNPILAKEYLTKYEEQCKKESIPFDYYELLRVNTRINDIGLSKQQLTKKYKLARKINAILKKESTLSNSELSELKELISSFSEFCHDSDANLKFYQGCYEFKRRNPRKAIPLFNAILEQEPKDFRTLKKLSEAYYIIGAFNKCTSTINRYIEYRTEDFNMYLLLVKCHLRNGNFEQLMPLTESLLDKSRQPLIKYISNVIVLLENEIEKQELKLYNQPTSHRRLKKIIQKLKDNLNKHQEMLGYLLNDDLKANNLILEHKTYQIYDDEIRKCLYDENNQHINLSNISSYIENLEISTDERMLLYLSAARVLFMNKLPKKAQVYLDLVARTPDKSETVKQEYDICQKNKKLYMNK